METQGCGMDLRILFAGTKKNHVTEHVCGAVVRTFSNKSRRSDIARNSVDRT